MNLFRTLPSPSLQAICLVGVFIFFEATLAGAATFYVNDNASGGNSGSSWNDAYNDLQDALVAAGAGDAIWVAAGLYLPGASETDTFQLKNGAEIYGGFQGLSGSEDDFGVRDVDTFLTILSGDLAGDDLSNASGLVLNSNPGSIVGANSDHVVTGSGTDGTAVLDGFLINAGQADGAPDDGGGMFNDGGSPTLSELTFRANLADANGGGMFNTGASSPSLTNIIFRENSAARGGGMYNNDINLTLTNVTFSDNSTSIDGGGMYNFGGTVTLINVTFSGNSGVDGGAIRNADTALTLTNVAFFGNTATNSGGGLYNIFGSSTLTNVLFSNNIADSGGGGILNNATSLKLTHVTLYRNQASFGGGLNNGGDSDPIIQNSIIYFNFVDTMGNQILNVDIESIPVISDSLVENSQGSGASWDTNLGMDGGGNIDVIPLFVNPRGADNTHGTLDDDLRLQSDSPVIDAGNNDHLPPDIQDLDDDNDTAEILPLDLDGFARVFNSTVDMGAYESQPGTLYVDDTAMGVATNGNDWTNAYTELQSALSRAVSGSTIWVAEGVYVPGNSENDTFQLKSGVEVYGGFEGLPGTEDDFGARDPEAFLTILSGDIDGDDVTNGKAVVTDTANIVGQNTDHVVTGSGTDGAAALDGFTITAGQTEVSGSDPDGGGILNIGGSPTLANLTFSGNSARFGGGMFNLNNSSPMLTNVTFHSNAALSNGGGMYDENSSPTLTKVIFIGNAAVNVGGGMSNTNSHPTLVNVAFLENSVEHTGDGLFGGGGIYNFVSSPVLTNVTFYGNSATGGQFVDGGAMSNKDGSNPIIQNTIFWGNTSSGSNPQIRNTNNNPGDDIPTLSNSLVEGSGGSGAGWNADLGTDGGGNIDADPLFSDPDGVDDILGTIDDDVRLLMGSPAIDSGSNTADLDAGDPGTTTISDIPTDLDGSPRIGNGTVDMGAYEFQQAPPTETPTPTFTSTPTETETPTSTATNTPTLTNTQPIVVTFTPTEAATETPTDTSTPTPTDTSTPTPTDTSTPTPTDTGAQTPTATGTTPDTQTPTATINTTNPPTPTATRDYDAEPQPAGNGEIDVQDLIYWFEQIKNGMEDGDLLFDFSRFWQSDVNVSK